MKAQIMGQPFDHRTARPWRNAKGEFRSRVKRSSIAALLAPIIAILGGCGTGQDVVPSGETSQTTMESPAQTAEQAPAETPLGDGGAAPTQPNPGMTTPGQATSFDKPATLGLGMDVSATPSGSPLTAQLQVHLSGWVPQQIDGRAFSGLMIDWGNGMYSHLQDSSGPPNCPQGGLYIKVDETYTYANTYAAAGQYDITGYTTYCGGQNFIASSSAKIQVR
jgi:hypothetical protein